MVEGHIFENTFQRKLIYVFRINDDAHKGYLKIGDATINSNLPSEKLIYPKSELKEAAAKRIDSYTDTASIEYELLYAELAIKEDIDEDTGEKVLKSFRDYEVHKVLKNSGIKNVQINGKPGKEWFKVDLETVKNAIKAVKNHQKSLTPGAITTDKSPIIFRPEQDEAIKMTVKRLKSSDSMLWNAKMRFGKTLCALQVAKELEGVGVKRTIIATHRPVVNKGWHDDFKKIFYDRNDYLYVTTNTGESLSKLEKEGKNFIYFASIQDLRGSKRAGGKFDKNDDVFDTKWDLVIIDEAHEGTTTEKGENVKELLTTEGHTKVIALSGTPFNILDKYTSEEVYTWDYMMEQSAKRDWDIKFCGDSNPYEELPQMKIYTYDLGENLGVSEYEELEDKAFNFKEFFRTWTEADKKKPANAKIGEFVHENDVKKFLNLISTDDKKSNYPYACEEYRNIFKHSLWMVPGVKEAKALSALLKNHKVFGNEQFFEIVNIAGDGDEEDDSKEALEKVEKAIAKGVKNGTYTITLSCGKLTTGVTIPEWTAVMMLSGSYSTSAANYLQTIFRVQSPANINGKRKEYCYVFDFAPDRTLKMVADAVQLSTKAGKTNNADRKVLGEFLNFCPVVSISGTKMEKFNENKLLQQLKRAYADRAVKSGFEDSSLYNDYLLSLDNIEMEKFNELKKIIGSSKPSKKVNEFTVNDQGLTKEERAEIERINKKPKRELTPEELEKLQKLKEQRDNANKAKSILRAISVRIPLLVFGGNIVGNQEKNIEKIEDLLDVDEASWTEFMPSGITKEKFKEFIKYYDTDVFSAACKKIRNIVKYADTLAPTERVIEISKLFSYFKNPDKETVLTPWRVVNMHLGNTLGGYCFFNEEFDEERPLEQPRFINHKNVTAQTLANKDAKILEMNSKTGLYPLYVTYSLFRSKCPDLEKVSSEEQLKIWNETVKKNVYVVCKTPMAKSITKRTLVGFNNVKINSRYFQDLINTIQNKPKQFVERIRNWNKDGKNMKFDAIVGNPPYQIDDGGSGASAKPIYHLFVNTSKKIEPGYISMIMPSRWMTAGKGLDEFRISMIHDKRISLLHDYMLANECFSNVDIKGGVCYFLWDKNNTEEADIYTHYSPDKVLYSKRFIAESEDDTFFIRDAKLNEIKTKVMAKTDKTFDTMVSARKPYGITADFFKDPSKYGLPPVSDNKIDGGYEILGLGEKLKRTNRYIPSDYPLPKTEGLDEIKIFISESYGSGLIGDKIPSPVIATPGMLCTETFLQIRPISTIDEAQNIVSYMGTKLFRALTGIIKTTQHGTQKVYSLVPVVDFSKKWTDKDLYDKFGLSQEDQDYIENLITD